MKIKAFFSTLKEDEAPDPVMGDTEPVHHKTETRRKTVASRLTESQRLSARSDEVYRTGVNWNAVKEDVKLHSKSIFDKEVK